MGRIRGFFFDQDGVIIDTERDGHLVSFNQAFQEFGLAERWDTGLYAELLQIAGGKERLRRFFPAMDQDLIARIHKRKTDIFIAMVESGALPLRRGVRRLMEEINQAGLVLGICTTSDDRVAHAIVSSCLHGIRLDFVLAGDAVARKKPDPAIYYLALRTAGLAAQECVVIEDSHIGVEAAKAAGLFVVATPSSFTEKENLENADVVVTSLGDPGAKGVLVRCGFPEAAGGSAAKRLSLFMSSYDGILRARHLEELFES